MKPFIKWAGGKTQFLEIISLLLPSQYSNFVEPFAGGGSVFLNIQPKQLTINDLNQELMITYRVVKSTPQALISLLQKHEKKHSAEFYEQLRQQETKKLTHLEIAARFIYLNKTGYNGLYRVNSRGEFNVPWGKRTKVKLFVKENILAIGEYLNENNCQGEKRVGGAQEIFIWNYELSKEQKQQLEFEKWFATLQTTNVDLTKLVNWKKIQNNLTVYEKDLTVLNALIGANQEELSQKIEQIWQEKPQSFRVLPFLLAIRDSENFAWLEKENIEYWEGLTLAKVKKLIFASGLAEYLTNGQIKDLKDYCCGIEVGLGTRGKKNLAGSTMEKAVEVLLNKYQVKYQKQVPVSFQVNGKKLFDFQISLKDKEYYLETSFYNSPGSKVSEVIRSYSGVLQKAQNNEINFLWILDGKGLKSVKELLKEVYLANRDFMFTIAGFEKWLKEPKELKKK